MDDRMLFSIRMHAASGTNHLCGAERIVGSDGLREVAGRMVDRVMKHGPAAFSSIRIQIESVAPETVRSISLLPVRTTVCDGPDEAAGQVRRFLAEAGVAPVAAQEALAAIAQGAAPGGQNMRGAMIIHGTTGERLEPDHARGVRVSRIDAAREVREELKAYLDKLGIGHFRVLEAVLVASKAAAVPGVMAEICRSDDPDYTTGYVASPRFGYVRVEEMKRRGDPLGGRAFFVASRDAVPGIMETLEKIPYLVSEIPHV
ncbi:MAG: 6-carboxyhexanoate--CoA ligase [bacterium]|nr:6-carboxyhexanoate--CoA ligase [bacterium]